MKMVDGLYLNVWGSPHGTKELAPGVVEVWSAGHGGVCLDAKPDYLPTAVGEARRFFLPCEVVEAWRGGEGMATTCF